MPQRLAPYANKQSSQYGQIDPYLVTDPRDDFFPDFVKDWLRETGVRDSDWRSEPYRRDYMKGLKGNKWKREPYIEDKFKDMEKWEKMPYIEAGATTGFKRSDEWNRNVGDSGPGEFSTWIKQVLEFVGL